MRYDPDVHHRRSIRLQGYDYSSAGAYYLTLCTYDRLSIFGDIAGGEMHANQFGEIVAEEWLKSAQMRREIALDEWVIMPNHMHAVVFILPPDDPARRGDRPVAPTVGGAGDRPIARTAGGAWAPGPRPRSLGALVAGFKLGAAKRINALRATPGVPVWQRNYYEHIIRNEDELTRIREYIVNNPVKWHLDREHPENVAVGDSFSRRGDRPGAPTGAPTGRGRTADDIETVLGVTSP